MQTYHGCCITIQILQDVGIGLFYSVHLERFEQRLEFDTVEGFLVVYECKAQRNVIFVCFFLQLVYDLKVVDR